MITYLVARTVCCPLMRYSNNSLETYSLSVKDHHNFFISEQDILVHNMAIFVMAPPAVPILASATIVVAVKTVAAVSIFGSCLYAFFCNSGSKKNSSNNYNHPQNNNNDGSCWCGHSCTFGCNCGCACNCGQKNSSKKTVDDLLKECTRGDETKGKTKQFTKSGAHRFL